MVTPRPTFTIQQAMSAVGVSRRTIYNWLNAGKLEYTRTAGGSIRIFADTLWLTTPTRSADTGSLSASRS